LSNSDKRKKEVMLDIDDEEEADPDMIEERKKMGEENED
jgi:hypothetical protein